MSCVNHPSVATAATCKSCGVELCGTCTRFLNSGEYCEKCAVVAEADAYLKSRHANQEKREKEVAGATSAREEKEASRNASQDKDRIFIWSGIGGATLMIFVSLGLYAFPNLFADNAVLAAQQEQIRLEQCRQVFQSIGIMLSEGQVPDESLRCPGTNVPNILSRNGGSIRVSHPNPQQYGLQDLYVTSDSHRVIMVGQGQS